MRRNRATKSCKSCGVEFEVVRSQATQYATCSKACGLRYRSIRQKGRTITWADKIAAARTEDIPIGTRFQKLTILRRVKGAWECRCDCGTIKLISNVKITKSCGCANGTHHLTDSPEFDAWHHIIQRCENPNNRGYKNYGGRGICVCPEWRESFEAFYGDMGPRPSPNHTLERINNNGNYEPPNCRWATWSEQSRNKRTNHFLTLNSETLTVADWSSRVGLQSATLLARIRRGWPDRRALMTPLLPGGPRRKQNQIVGEN